MPRKKLCPGKSAFLKDSADLTEEAFGRLVARRARSVLQREVLRPTTIEDRRELEGVFNLEVVNLEEDFLPARFLEDGASEQMLSVALPCRFQPPALSTGPAS